MRRANSTRMADVSRNTDSWRFGHVDFIDLLAGDIDLNGGQNDPVASLRRA